MNQPFPKSEPTISVGIVRASRLTIDLQGQFDCRAANQQFSGRLDVSFCNGHVVINGQIADNWHFIPESDSSRFVIHNVEIGIGFHWDKRENQVFGGILRFVIDGEMLWAVNVLGVESYLTSVISSEMNATSDIELLKAHAVTSRSWLMAQVWGKGHFHGQQKKESDTEILTWRDREDHTLFDVCADDHCQRYQGLTRVTNPKVEKAIDATRGQILTYEGKVCDARFSKCCGGKSELFESCWDDTPHPYLQSINDALQPTRGLPKTITSNDDARQWITASPDAFCNTTDTDTLRQVLNDYDQTTSDFFRWSVNTSGAELGSLIREKGNRDIGDVTALEALHRGPSGRITRLKIIGTKGEFIVGKELEIRRLLSPTHLYSSAFVTDFTPNGGITLRGAGWGHGVGLCQIGAAVMAKRGFSYRSIVYHYFRRAQIEKAW